MQAAASRCFAFLIVKGFLLMKIIVAGAGHGGLTAAYNLAKNGFDVTVFEKNKREDIGYDWHDALNCDAFDKSGIERPDASLMRRSVQSSFENPSASVRLVIPLDENDGGFMLDRKELVNYLIDKAESVGVKLVFGCEIKGALLDGMRVAGIKYVKNAEELEEKADMVIDACGMNSPVRKSLPPCFGIKNSFEAKETFHVYRAYFENLTGEVLEPSYLISLFHMGKPGIDWLLTEKDSVDILVGKFGTAGELSPEEIEQAVSDYRERYPFIGQRLIRGGSVEKIPLSKMLPLLVADGYALVGDSAGMTIPLNGSGIVLSMCAGKILADKICEVGDSPFSVENLWHYQYEYFQTLGKELVMIDILKNFFTFCKGKDVDYFLEKKILTEEMLNFGQGINIAPKQILHIASVALPLIGLLPPLVETLRSIPSIDSVAASMPAEYEKMAVEDWMEKYSAL